jgi:hypothetical protein
MATAEERKYTEQNKASSAMDEWYEKPPQEWGQELERQIKATQKAQKARAFAQAWAAAIVQQYHKDAIRRRREAEAAQPAAQPSVSPEVEAKFRALAEQWYIETMPLSSYFEKILHPAYQKILTLGKAAVPFILRELEDEPNDWFWALRMITDADPVTAEQAGDMEAMAQAWLRWGRGNGYI